MICTNCNTLNGPDSVFCVNCGNAVTARLGASSPTVPFHAAGQPSSQGYTPPDSTETAVVNLGGPQASMPRYTPIPPHSGEHKVKRTNPIIWIAVGLIAVIGLIVVGGFLIIPQIGGGGGEILPDHLGMFVQSAAKDRNDEISKQDFSKVSEAKDTLLKNDNLAALDPQPNLILYADGKDIPINDLRLIQLESIKDDGSMKQLDFQVAPVDGKPEMKRIRMPQALANGKYAFALLDSYFNEGKHKFWAFQVRNSQKSENGDALKASSLPLKGLPPPQPSAPNVPRASIPPPVQAPIAPPAGARVAYTKTNNVLVRRAPDTGATVVGKLGSGQTVYVFGTSGYGCFTGKQGNYGCGPWAQVQTASGTSGYILSVLLR